MKRLLARLTKPKPPPAPAFDLDAELGRIRQAEENGPVAPGRLLHRFAFGELDLRLDRDVAGHYRVTVEEDGERRYSFTVRCAPGNTEALRRGLEEVVGFLSGSRRVAGLPRHEGVQGHYYGPREAEP